MDPLSVTASITSLLQLSGAISKYCASASHGRRSCERLQRELDNTRVVLEHIQESTPGEGDARQNVIKKLSATRGPLEQLQQLLASLDKSLARFQRRTGALRWPFHEKEIQASIDLLHRLKTLFIWAQVNDSANLTDAVHADLQDIKSDNSGLESRLGDLQGSVDELTTGLEYQTLFYRGVQREQVLQWLCQGSASSKQTERYRTKIKEHCEGTDEWILCEPKYVQWQSGCSSTNTLVCRGPPGSGKSVLAAFITNHLQHTFQGRPILVTRLFCSSDEPYESSYDLFLSLLHEALSQFDELPPDIECSFLKHKDRRSNPSLSELRYLLRKTFSYCDRAFVVVDALDVCSAETRTEICKTLRDIGDHVSLLLTCQNSGALSKLLPLQAVVEVSANDRDVARYVHSRIDQAYTLQELIFEDSELHGQICQAVIDKCQGLFLIARLHMDSIVQSGRRRNLIHNLRELPHTIELAYESALERIMSKHRELALRVLMWIVFAKETITASRLQHALSIERYYTRFDKDDTYSINFLLEICNGLVQLAESGDRLELVHFSLADYLKAKSTALFPDLQAHIAQKCFQCILSYDLCDTYKTFIQLYSEERRTAVLSFKPYDDRICFKRSMDLGFMGYAIRHGFTHAAASKAPETEILLRRLFDGSTFFSQFSEMYIYLASRQRLESAPCITQYNELCLSICLGLSSVTHWLLQKGVNPNISSFSSTGWISPLALAAWFNDTPTAMELIEYGAEPDLPATFCVPSCRNGRVIRLLGATPLEIAALRGSVVVMNILIDSGSICNSHGREEPYLASSSTCAGDHTRSHARPSCDGSKKACPRIQRSSCPTTGSAVMVTVDEDSDSDTRSLPCRIQSRQRTESVYNEPLIFFLLRHCERHVCTTLSILLDDGLIEPNVFDKHSNTPLHALTTNYSRLGNPHSLARALLQAGADANARNCKGLTPLHLATSLSLRNLAHLLVTLGAGKHVEDKAGRTPIDVADEIDCDFSAYLSEVPERPQEGALANQTAFFDDTTSGKSPVSATFDVVSLYETEDGSKEPESVFSRQNTSGTSFNSIDEEVDFMSVREVMERGKRYRNSRMTWGRR